MPVERAVPTADFVALLGEERRRLLDLLGSLEPQDWSRPTPCPAWDVAGLCRHLLGDDVHVLSRVRDGHLGTAPPGGVDERDFVAWLDELQVGWVDAARRISPRLVADLLAWLGPQLVEAFAGTDQHAVTERVSWASDGLVPMWLETARELTEYWIHRQQLLVALGRPADLSADLLGPVLDALRWAYPYRLAALDVPLDSVVRIDVVGATERRWALVARRSGWEFDERATAPPLASLRVDGDVAWRLLTNNLPAGVPLDVVGDPAVVDILRRTRAIIGSPR